MSAGFSRERYGLMRVGSHRPPFLHLVLFFSAYVLGCGFAQALAIVPGISVSIWPPGGVFIATLILASPYSWPWWMLAGCLAEMFAQLVWFHSPLPAGFLIYVGNALCAAVGATLLNRICGSPVRLESLRDVLAFVVLGAGVAPLASATVGSAALAWFGVKSQTFTAVWPLFWIGDATGILLVAPLALVVIQQWRSKTEFSAAQWMEAGVLGLIFLGVAALSLSSHYLPFAFIIMPPLLWAAVRFEFKGVAVALSVLALMTMALTISGGSQFIGDPESQREKQIMLQLFLVISALSALIVAAISREHQLALLTLRASERQLRQFLDAVPIHCWSATPAGVPSYINKRARDYMGIDIADFEPLHDPRNAKKLQEAIFQTHHPEDAAEVQRRRQQTYKNGEKDLMRFRRRGSDGIYRWMETRLEPLRDQDGTIVQWYGVSVDIDEAMRAQEALRRSERQLQQLIDTVPANIWCATPEGVPCYLNKRATDLTGLTVQDLIGSDGSRSLTLVHPDDREDIDQALARAIRAGASFEGKYRQRRANGPHRWVESRAEPLRDDFGNIVQWYGVTVDIDDQVRLYRELEEREARSRRLIDSDVLGIVIWDLDGKLIDANDAFLRMVQYDRDDLKSGLDWFAMTPPEWQDVHAREEAEELARTGKMQAREKEYFRKDGSRVPILIGAVCFEGNPSQGIAYILDLTERKRGEAALRDRERELSQLVDMVPAHIRRMTPQGEPVFFNKRLRDYYGLDVADIGNPGLNRLDAVMQTVVHPNDVDRLLETARASFASGEPFSMKYRTRGANGVYRWVDTRTEPLRDEGGAILQWYAISLDIDDEVRAQEGLRAAQDKLARATQAASLSELSASIAHEVNQPLAAIVATSHACHRWLSADPPNLERAKMTLERIIRDANSASEVVSRIRALFNQLGKTRLPADMTEVIAGVRLLMAEELAIKNVQVETEIAPNLPPAFIDPVQMEQVLVNLIRNAIDALDTVVGGIRLIRLRAVLDSNNTIRVEVQDLGPGMKEPEQAFEPFFTTKKDGMGMGLAICRSIIESHNGRLWAINNQPRGTTLAFTLPIQARDAA